MMPKARALIDGASLGPEALSAATRAFDEAWAEIARHFSQDPIQVEAARLSLANAVLSITSDDGSRCTVAPKSSDTKRERIGYLMETVAWLDALPKGALADVIAGQRQRAMDELARLQSELSQSPDRLG